MTSRSFLFTCAVLFLSLATTTFAQDDQTSRSVTITGAPHRDIVVVDTDESLPRVFDRVCEQTEQWHNVHVDDIRNAVQILRARGPEMADYIADYAMNAAQGRHDHVFWSIACGALAHSNEHGQSVLRWLAGHRTVDPWARLAARQAMNGNFAPR